MGAGRARAAAAWGLAAAVAAGAGAVASCAAAGDARHVRGAAASDVAAGDAGQDGSVADAAASETDGGALALALPELSAEARAALHLEIATLVRDAVGQRKVPGAVVAVGRRDGLLYEEAFGNRSLEPAVEPMTKDTLFDLASLTKVVATTTAAMVLVDDGRVDLDAPAARVLPELSSVGKGAITPRQLLTHTAGLVADTPLADYTGPPEDQRRRLFAARTVAAPGARFLYSDVGFQILGELVARAAGEDLATFTRRRIFQPFGMRDTGFLPPESEIGRIAPTERVDGRVLRREVHDPRARGAGGVSGHAGLFGTARDLARFARVLLGDGRLEGRELLSSRRVRELRALHDVDGGLRALGWDVATSFSKSRPEGASRRAFGHAGYTGTSLWIDPGLDLFVVVLTNRVHPDGAGGSTELAARVGGAAVRALARPEDPVRLRTCPDGATRAGIDALDEDGFARLRGRRVGLVTNGAARTRAGERTLDRLARAPDVSLVRLFAPEHGLAVDREGAVAGGVEPATGLPVVSLYGKTLTPPRATLEDLDAVVVDLPDVGARFYTYASTLHRVMKGAADAGVPVVVLDRPNPLGGHRVHGPMLAEGRRSFVNHHPLPVEHGLTLGELGELFAAAEHLPVAYDVVEARGWRRGQAFPTTGLAWVAPSPNLRTYDEALLYPGVALVEGTNVSVGRGTDTPFELVGAPFVDGARLARALASHGLAGVRVAAEDFVPRAGPHAGATCHGVRFTVTDRDKVEPVRLGLALARALASGWPAELRHERLGDLVGDDRVVEALRTGRPLDEIERLAADGLAPYLRARAHVVRYDATTCVERAER